MTSKIRFKKKLPKMIIYKYPKSDPYTLSVTDDSLNESVSLRAQLRNVANTLKVPHENHIEPTALVNPDLEPMPPHRRIWGFFSFFGYWAVPNLTIWTWSTGSAILGLGSGSGLNIAHVMGCLTIGNIIICIYTCLNSGPGSKYHIGYTICQRMIFGVYGSSLGILIRIILSIVFYGSQSWLGGCALVVVFSSFSERFMNLPNSFPDSLAMTTRDFIGFLVFQVIQFLFYFMKPEKLNSWTNGSCVITFIAFIGILATCLAKNHGPGPLYHAKVDMSAWETGWMWFKGMTIWYGALSPDVTNQSDFSRFASSEKKMYAGIISSVMLTGTFVPLAGLVCASATAQLYGHPYWLPTDIVLKWLEKDYSAGCRAAAFFLGFAFASSQLMFNVMANGVAGGMDLSGVFPKYINIRRGAIITALLSWVVQPWNFYNTQSVFINVMSSFGVIVTPIIAILVADFHVIRKRKLPLLDLYTTSPEGCFYFTKGVNLRAMSIWVVSVVPGIVGLVQTTYSNELTGIQNFFSGSIVFSFAIPFVAYIAVCKLFPMKTDTSDKEDFFGAFTLEECEKMDLVPHSDSSMTILQGVNQHIILPYTSVLEENKQVSGSV